MNTGETTQKITINAGDYQYGFHDFSCQVTNTDGCSNSGQITIEVKDCTAIDEISNTVGVETYPNPNNGIFNLDLNVNGNKKISLRIISSTGKLVYHKENLMISGKASLQVDLSNEANGLYTVFVVSDGAVSNNKIVLNR